MGLSGHLHDVSGDSIPLLLLAAVATSISYLRSLLLRLVHLQHLVSASGASVDSVDVEHAAALGSGLAGLVVLADHLASSPSFAFALPDPPPEAGDGGARRPGPRPECVVCLCGLGDGDRVRRLPCRHVFHRECVDGWFRQMNLSCPLCRSPIAPPELRSACDRRIGRELVAWLSTSSY